MLVLHHATYSINSLCHFFGRRDFETRDESRNLRWLTPFTMGEAWHNSHHAFPTSAVHGMAALAVRPLGGRDLGAGEDRAGVGRRPHQPGAPGRAAGKLARADGDATRPSRCARRSRRRSRERPFRVELWDGSALPRPPTAAARPSACARRSPSGTSCARPGSSASGRAYVSGAIDVDSVDGALELLDEWSPPPIDAKHAGPAGRRGGPRRRAARRPARARRRAAPAAAAATSSPATSAACATTTTSRTSSSSSSSATR